MLKRGYVTLGSRDLARACAFYDALLGELDAIVELLHGPAFREAMSAMAEKRAPDFSAM